MKISKHLVADATYNLSQSTTNKFWGLLALLHSLNETIVPNKLYTVSSISVMNFLDELFNFDSAAEKLHSESNIYVKFSTQWQEKLNSLTLKTSPNLLDAAIFYFKKKNFSEAINSDQLKKEFLNACKIDLNKITDLFIDQENTNLELENYENSVILREIEKKFNVDRKGSNYLSFEAPFFIQSRPSELKRAGFFQTLYSSDKIKELLLVSDTNLDEFYPSKQLPQLKIKFDNSFNDFNQVLNNSGLSYNKDLITRFIASLLTKPFVILTGLSGSGKTKLAQSFAQWICNDENQYRVIPVGADWTNREPLLGYPNALKPEEYVKPDSGALDLIIQANQKPSLPHFLILDEMNLSHVERYFADFLSVMESNEEISLYSEDMADKAVPAKIKIPANLFIIGTVNIDETTNMFSPKVLDRANTIEFRVTKDEMKTFLESIKAINLDELAGKGAGMAKSFVEMSANKTFATSDIDVINSTLVQFFSELKKTGAEFGYRSATEILRLIHQLTVLDNTLSTNQKIDIAIMQKLLPKLHGSRRKLCPVLETLGSFCITEDIQIIKEVFENQEFDFTHTNVKYPLSLEKIARMYRGAIDNGFASFAEA